MLSAEYLQGTPDEVVKLYRQVEDDILADMARRIDGFDLYIPAAQYQGQMLQEMGMLQSEIVERLASMTSQTTDELTAIMKAAGVEALSGDMVTYAAAGLTVTSSVSDAVQQTLLAGLEKTQGLFTNLTSTTANTATKQFENALDKAYMKVNSGAFDGTSAVTSAIKELSSQGVGAITYPSGHVDSLEVAVRRAVTTGVNQTCGKVQEALAKEMGCDLVEVSAHAGAREEHATWQGQVYSLSGKSKTYPSLVRVTGYGTGAGLMGWNCSHSFSVYIEGFPRAYSDEQLKAYQDKTCSYNGVKLTQSEAQAKQRYIERNIRKYKREVNALESAGLDASKEKAKLKEWNATLGDFVEQTGQKLQPGRTVVGKGLTFSSADDIIIGKSVGAKAKNYSVLLPDGTYTAFAEGTSITNVKTIAGKGRERKIDEIDSLLEMFGGAEGEWMKCKGLGYLDYNGEIYRAEVHWYQESTVGKVKFKAKSYDGEWILDD